MNYSHLNILIVEDNKINQLLVKNMLTRFGFSNFIVAGDGKSALKKISENTFDIILLDIQMPGMDGYEIANEIRKMDDAHRSVPIIALTGNGSEKDKARAVEADINAYVVKPFTAENFYSTLLKYAGDPSEKTTKGKVKKQNETKKVVGKTKKPATDLSFLEKYTGGDLRITAQLIEIFLREVPDAIEKLEQFIEQGKWKEVHAVAHKVKSNFAIFEFNELRKIVLTIENNSRESANLEDIPKLFLKFKEGCVEILFTLGEEYRRLKKSKAK